jgi:DNA-binding PadR family transcriptional regulator
MESTDPGSLERGILLHLLEHRGHQVRFEADQWTTEFGILRSFPAMDPAVVRQALRNLEVARWIYRRVQYVIGYSEPKLVYTLTPSGHRKALDLQREGGEPIPALVGGVPPPAGEVPTSFFNIRGVLTTDGRDVDV